MKIVKLINNTVVTAHAARPVWIAGFMLLASIAFVTGCSSGELSRRQTVAAITEAANYKQPSVTSIDIGSLPNAYARAWQLSKDEKEEASGRSRQGGFQSEAAAANHRRAVGLYPASL